MLLIPSFKKITKKQPIEHMADPEIFYLPLEAYRNTMEMVVKEGERVKKYQLLARSEGVFSSRLHAPASGMIIGNAEINGIKVLKMSNDFLDECLPATALDPTTMSAEQLLNMLDAYGIEGSGGARFPTHTKYRSAVSVIETLIINGAECEPYLSADLALMRHKADDLMYAAKILLQLVKPGRIVFAIEKQNKGLKHILQESAARLKLAIEIILLPDSYPQGGELQLIKSATGLEIAKGSIPAAYGIVVSNTGTLWAICQAFRNGRPYIERVITLSGNGITNMGNFYVKIGTPIDHILESTGNQKGNENKSIILGGPMMGRAVQSRQTPINKGSGAVLVLNNFDRNNYNCIKCGFCVDVCPQHLMPLEFVRHNLQPDIEKLKGFHLNDCIECGACAYICPSEVPLMQNIFEGKKKLLSPKNG